MAYYTEIGSDKPGDKSLLRLSGRGNRALHGQSDKTDADFS